MNIIDLPPEILCMIINYLQFKDRVSFRNVCYLFWKIIDIDELMIFGYPYLREYNYNIWKIAVQYWHNGIVDYIIDRYDILSNKTGIVPMMMEYNPYNFIKSIIRKNGLTMKEFLHIKPFIAFRYCNSHELLLLINVLANIELNGEKIPRKEIIENMDHIRDRIIYEDDEIILNTLLSYFDGLTIKDVFPSWQDLKKCIFEGSMRVFRYSVSYDHNVKLSNTCILSALKGYYVKDV